MIGLWMWLAAAGAEVPAESPLSSDSAVERALERSPEVAAARAEVERSRGLAEADCGLRQDPTVRASTAVVGHAWSVSVAQPVSITGEGRSACAAARQTVQASAARLRRARLHAAAATRYAFADAVAASSREALAAQALEVARGIASGARHRTEVGEAPLLDLRLARLQLEQARTAWMTSAVSEGRSLAELAILTGVSVEALVLPDDPLVAVSAPRGGAPEVRSDVQAARADLEAARRSLAQARAATLAPVSLGVFVEEEGTERRAGPTVSVVLPVWRGNADGRASAGATLEAAEVRAATRARAATEEQASAARTQRVVEAALADQPADLPEEARAALQSVALGFDRGELDLLTTSLLQAEVLAGHQAWLEGRRLVARARIDLLVATDDVALLGSGLP